eukprot:GHRR01007114.1.p1 GENE.GHRR01007114.1~~GHRR01007114.1.p1  ORF type:complete len:187 (+),score=64.26 GHRR01007114.1:640-1200(+)
MTCWRAQVMYVHQSRVNYKGTPAELFALVESFGSQRGKKRGDLKAVIRDLGLQPGVLNQPWPELSGGQAQRVSLALAIALQPKVLLLDEPTSACDQEATVRVEAALKECSSAIVWVTHDNQQPHRVGGKILELPTGAISSVAPDVNNRRIAGSSNDASNPEDHHVSGSSMPELLAKGTEGEAVAVS